MKNKKINYIGAFLDGYFAIKKMNYSFGYLDELQKAEKLAKESYKKFKKQKLI